MIKSECSSIIVGKSVSETGKFLVGHNEDNRGLLVMPQYYVPRETHVEDEYIQFEKNSAKIPQVEEKLGFFWSETRSVEGHSFADGFINECGVGIFSDGCYASKEETPDLKDGGIGYGLRRILAERATSASHGLDIAIELIEEYGYNDSGRSYQIVDKDTAWVIQVAYGKNYVARKVKDDEVVFVPNRYTIHEIDFDDTENYRYSQNLIKNAIDKGWYTPSKEGDFSDFSFAETYQRDYQDFDARQHVAQWMITGTEPEYDRLPFSVKPNRKLGIEDIKEVLRSHYENTRFDASNNYKISPYRTNVRVIDAFHTQCSNIIEFNDNKELTVIWKSLGRTATSIYNPIFLGSKNISNRMSFIDPKSAINDKFNSPDQSKFKYNSELYWWKQMEFQDLIEPQFKIVYPEIHKEIKNIEKKYSEEIKDIIKKLSDSKNEREFMEISSQFSDEKIEESFSYIKNKINEIENINITVAEKELNVCSDRDIEIIISSEKLNILNIDLTNIRMGIYYISPYERALPKKTIIENDAIKMIFSEKDLTFGADKNIDNNYEFVLWADSKANDIIVGKTVLNIKVKDNNKF